MRTSRLTRALQTHDRELYCAKDKNGVMGVYRRGHRWVTDRLGSSVIGVLTFSPHFIFALTDNWRTNGKPVDWGIEPVLARIKALDLWNRDIASEVIEQNEKIDESNKRDLSNSIESFCYEFRDHFKRAFGDTRIANMDKTDRRKKDELKLKQKGF